MSSNYVFMKAANTEPTGKRLNWTASLKVRDMTITVWTLNLTAPVQLRRVRASYSFIFKCYYALLVASTAAALTERRFWFGLGCGKEKNGVLELLVNTEKGASLHLWTFLSLLSSRLLFFCLHRHGWQLHMRATDCTKKISLHRGCRCPVISVCVWFFFITWLSEVQEGAGVRILSVLLWNGTSMFANDELHPHSENEPKHDCDHLSFSCNIRLQDF